VASLYNARQRYEDVLARSSSLSIAAANLQSAAILEQAVRRERPAPQNASARAKAAAAFDNAAAIAAAQATDDPPSERLVRAQIAAGPSPASGTLAAQIQARQTARQAAARRRAAGDSRRAIVLIVIAGVLALVGALALISGLIGAMRRPLDELVNAAGGLAGGDLERRVTPSGPRELRELGAAFNAMASELATAQQRIDSDRLRLAVTIESLGDGLIVTERGSTRIAAVNPRARELVPELGVGDSVEAEAAPLPALADALAGEEVIEHGGRTLAVTAARLGDESEGFVWTVRDISDRARLERAKSEFVATASHELRSPLTSIKGFVELLQRSPDGMSERQREFIEIILKSTDRLTDLVADLLDVARIEADRVQITRRPIDVGEAVRETAELMGPRIAEKHQRLSVYVAPALPLALADPARVRQIVANLVTNAHLYTGEGGTVRLRVEPERAWVQITVQDSGVGMTDEQKQQIFDRFYRAPEGSAATQGTGLGLSIVKSLVEMHDGQIEVESEPGRGSAFSVRLPAAMPEAELAESLEAIRDKRVLVVDDERDIAELIAGQLGPLGVLTEIATTGAEALSILRGSRFDAVTLDVLMPGMNGFEVLEAIRSDPDLHPTPIVFVSVFSGRRELAGEWVVSKPIDADELRHVLAAAVKSGRSRVLVVGRQELRPVLEPSLGELGIEHQWEQTGAAAARACAERRFEVALIDVGLRNPQAVLEAIDLRGRRERRATILFSDPGASTPPGIERLGMEVVAVEDAASAVLTALHGIEPAE
jgi:signal transduction histidine kinase/CheY-like chemotaxis protein